MGTTICKIGLSHRVSPTEAEYPRNGWMESFSSALLRPCCNKYQNKLSIKKILRDMGHLHNIYFRLVGFGCAAHPRLINTKRGAARIPSANHSFAAPLLILPKITNLFMSRIQNRTGRTAKTKYRNFATNIPRKGISGSQYQFPHSCVCERFIEI
jgi:hypothetical protein